jgi:hypothetical protein
VVIRATDTELDLSGPPAELSRLAAALRALGPGEHRRFGADSAADPRPYDRLLAALEVVASSGPVRVGVAGDTLSVSGSPDMLGRLATFLEFPEGAAAGTHRHHEWWDGNEYVAADSRPLVISAAEPGPAADPRRQSGSGG